MNNRILILLAIILCATLPGCGKNDAGVNANGTVYSENFVQIYTIPNDMNIFIQGKIDGEIPYDVIKISFPGERIDWIGHYTEEGKEAFRKLAEQHNDVSFNKRLVPGNQALSVPLNSITMTCDRDFDAAHGAGDPLDDIVTLFSWSPYDFIQRGYKEIPSPNDIPEGLKWYHGRYGYDLLRLPLSEVNAETAKMLEYGGLLIFSKKPDAGGEYTFTVTAEINGKTHSKQIGYTFD